LLFVTNSTTKKRAEFQFSRFEESPVTVAKVTRRQFMKAGGIGVVGLLASRANAWSSQTNEVTLYVGTYTSGKSEGIYVYRFDRNKPGLRCVSAINSINPSFLTIDRSKRYLYAVNEVGEYLGKPGGGVSAFAIDPANGNLRLLNQQATQGADPCHLTIDSRKRSLLVANYTGGSVSVLPVRTDGTLGMVSEVLQHEGSGPKEQQKGPHAHCVILDPNERYAFASNLGTDKVMIYRFDRATGKLTPAQQPFAELKAGAGPRHLTLHPSGKYLYVINELDSTMAVFGYDARNGTLTLIETVSTLPEDFSGVSYCADVHVSASGRFLYGSNRGHNSIVVFEIDQQTGKLKLVQHRSTEGDWPRNFALDPSGQFLLVANQRSDNVVTFILDERTGQIIAKMENHEIPSPVCLKFL
jgi:6-phosphogluconolactonase